MELKDVLYGKRVYFDADILLYLLEGFEYSKSLKDLKDLMANDKIEAFTSQLVFADVISICAPNSERDLKDNAVNFVDTFNPSDVNSTELIGVYKEINEMSSIRSTHVLSAIENKCDIFLTNDSEIKAVPDCLKLVLFSDYENILNLKQHFLDRNREDALEYSMNLK